MTAYHSTAGGYRAVLINGNITLYTPDGARDLSSASAGFLLSTLQLDTTTRQAIVNQLARALGVNDTQSDAPPGNATEPRPHLVAPNSVALPAEFAPRLVSLSSMGRKWNDAVFASRVKHTGHQLDQRTIASEAGFAEHRHGTKYFREMESAGIGVYRYGRFYYHGEQWQVVAPSTLRKSAPVEQRELL